MDIATLVGLDLEIGSEVVSALESAGITVSVALWMLTPEFEEGRLAIASPKLDQINQLRAYEQLFKALRGKFVHALPPIRVFRMRDPFIKELREKFGRPSSTSGMRLGGQMIGNRFISDGYVYKIK